MKKYLAKEGSYGDAYRRVMIQVYHVILDDDDREAATECAKDAGMSLEEWLQFAVDYAVSQKLTPEKE